MNSLHTIRWALPCCQSSDDAQTRKSIGLRITTLAIGAILLTTGLLALLNITSLSSLGTIGGVSLTSLGGVVLFPGIAVKQIKRHEIETSPTETEESEPLVVESPPPPTLPKPQESDDLEESLPDDTMTHEPPQEVVEIQIEDPIPAKPERKATSAPLRRKRRVLKEFPENLAPPEEATIHSGYGEYILYSKSGKSIAHEKYSEAYTTLHQHSLSYFLEHFEGEELEEVYTKRGESLKKEMETLNADWGVFFVPRTLYELIFIHACLEEDLTAEAICPMYNFHNSCMHEPDDEDYEEYYEKKLKKVFGKRAVCWHRCQFHDVGDPLDQTVVTIAYQLNNLILETFPNPTSIRFSHVKEALQKEVTYLSGYFGSEKGKKIVDCNKGGPGSNFRSNSTRGIIKPLGIETETQKTIVFNTFVLECSQLAQNHLFLFRGARFNADSPEKYGTPFSLSYGSSLYAGFLYDGGATAFHYMRQENHQAFVTSLPIGEVQTLPFYYPLSSTVCQFFGMGEIFHGRTKSWLDGGKPGGIQGGERRWEHLQSDIPQETFLEEFERCYTENTFSLKTTT